MAKDIDVGMEWADSSLACDSRGKNKNYGNKPFLTWHFFWKLSRYLTFIAKKRIKDWIGFYMKNKHQSYITYEMLGTRFHKNTNVSYEKVLIWKTWIKDGTDHRWENISHITYFIWNVHKSALKEFSNEKWVIFHWAKENNVKSDARKDFIWKVIIGGLISNDAK